MTRHLFLKTITLCIGFMFAFEGTLFAQPTNANSYRLEIHHTGAYGRIATDVSSDGDQVHRGKAALNNANSAVVDLFSAANGGNAGATCASETTDNNQWFYFDQNMGTFYGSTNGLFNWAFSSWEDDEGDLCVYNSGDENGQDFYNKFYATGHPQSVWYEHPQQTGGAGGNGSYEKFKSTWRFTNGEKTSPLDFGNLTAGTIVHSNVNRGVLAGANADLGYKDQWTTADNSAFKNGNDITYKFNLAAGRRIIFSTSFAETNFDTYLHVIKLNPNGTFNSYIGGDDDSGDGSTSLKQLDLCTGLYAVIVEGYSFLSAGDFKVSLQVSDISVAAGTITISSDNSLYTYICPGATIPAIFSTAVATSTLGSITYKWFRTTYNGSWSSWAEYPAAGTSSSATNLGDLGTNTGVAYFRLATDCGSSAGTASANFFAHGVSASGGTIAGSTMIPSPRELPLGTLTSTIDGSATPVMNITWEKDDGGGWGPAIPSGSGQTYTLPELTQTTKYRRKTTSTCPTVSPSYSNEQIITVINPNGILQGKVVSNSQAGVNDVTISAQRTTPVTGGLPNKIYTTTTNSDGTYAITGVYYGSQVVGSGATANFTITPSKNIHVFDPVSLTKTTSQLLPVPADANFVDKTVFSVTGIVQQYCTDCNGATVGNPIACPIPKVEFLVNNIFKPLNKTITDGTYSLSIDEQGSYTVKPRYKNHQFELSEQILAIGVSQSYPNINFKDTSTRVISGYVRAGCDEYIGQATLRFTQVLPDVNGNPVTGCLIKDITTNLNSGYYAVRLPASTYRASVVSFTPSSDLNGLTVTDFLNLLNKDSLTRNIDTTNRILHLIYPRPPVLEVVNGLGSVCTTPTAFSLMKQSDSTAFTIKVWQGPAAKGCPAKDSLVRLATNIQNDDGNENLEFPNPTGVIEVKLKGGYPNIVSPYFKTFNLQYTDLYKRAATAINKNVVVTGLKADASTFTTVSPEVPIMVLHDPPGDGSFSSWEANSTTENLMKWSVATDISSSVYEEAKIGYAAALGVAVSTDDKSWGSIKGTFTVGAKVSSDNETTISLSNTQSFSTTDDTQVTGTQGDVYIGAAINLKYAKTHTVSYTAPCTVNLSTDFIIAPNGFATNYVYSEDHIITTIIPTLKNFRDNPSNTLAQTNNYINQIKVWEQIIANNEKNKKTAPFEKNISFDGSAGAIVSTTVATTTKANTLEFGVEISVEMVDELGFEIAGSGITGGLIVNTKMEMGGTKTKTTTKSTTTSYTLDDANSGDYFSIDIKKDPVYSTPVFELVAGTSSCPWEKGTQPRDAMQLVASPSTVSGIAANGEAEFTLLLSNTSQSGETRIYNLSLDQATNPNGAVITIGGSPVVLPTSYTISPLGQIPVIVKVKRGASNVFTYTDLTFNLTDNCDGDPKNEISKSVKLNAYFNGPCSNITLYAPTNNWAINNNILPIIMKDYVVANLTNVSLEYSKVGTSDWLTGFTKTSVQLSPDINGTQVNWDITSLTDGQYNLRLRLICSPSNVTYSQTITGIIDRKAPIRFGKPEPTDDNYVNGDLISATYNEKLGCANLNNNNLIVKNLRTNTIVSAQLGCYENKIVIVPLSSLGAINDSMQITLQNIQDPYGNIKTTPDVWYFIIGTSVAATGNSALSLNPTTVITDPITTDNNGVLVAISKLENATGTMDFYFNLPANVTHDVLINYSVSGSANANNDFTVSYFPTNQPTSTQFYGTGGTITIKAGQKYAILKIDPTGDTNFEGNETIIITTNEGGDYGIAASYTMTGTILNDDADDCLNGGIVYQLSNNNVGNTAIVAGTYHKSLLETDGKVVVPTDVTMKGAKSILMKPGFEVKAGAIFRANIEGCPQGSPAFSMPLIEGSNQTTSIVQFASLEATPTNQVQTEIAFEPNVFAAVNDKKIYFEFKLEKDEKVTLILLNNYGGEVVRVLDKADYKAGIFTVEIETALLTKGDYFIKMLTKDKKIYQKVTIL
jgi:hypothetical protein